VTEGRPVLLTVDDDPAVSRAVARDLRRQYGESYRVVRAESGPAALDACASSPCVATEPPCCSPTTGCPG
jgi:CheY-like chemotaxis protein